MKRLLLIALCLLAVLSLAVSSHAANKIWPATCITGGGDCLDGISGASLNPGDGAVVPIDGTSQFRFYILKNYTTDVPTESSPTYITPDSYPGNKRWVLIGTFPIVYTDLTGLSANMMSFLGGTSYANMRTLLGLAIGTDVQAYSANLTTFAGIAPSANVQSLLGAADYSGMRALLGLVIGTNVQAHSSNLTTFAGIAPSANVQTLLDAVVGVYHSKTPT